MELRVWGGRSVSYLFPEEGQRVFRLFLFLFFSLLRAGSHPDNLKQKGPVCPCDVHWRSSRELHPPPSSAPFTYYTTSLLDGDTASSSSSSSFSLRAALLQIQIQVPLLSRGFPRRAQRGTLREKKKKKELSRCWKAEEPPQSKALASLSLSLFPLNPPLLQLLQLLQQQQQAANARRTNFIQTPSKHLTLSCRRTDSSQRIVWHLQSLRSRHSRLKKKKKKMLVVCLCVCERARERKRKRWMWERFVSVPPPLPQRLRSICARIIATDDFF